MAYFRCTTEDDGFETTLTVTANRGATVTATSGNTTYTSVAGSNCTVIFTIKHIGTYTITTSISATVSATVNITDITPYTADVFVNLTNYFITNGACTIGWGWTQGYGPWGDTWKELGHVSSYSASRVNNSYYNIYMRSDVYHWGQTSLAMSSYIDCSNYTQLHIDLSGYMSIVTGQEMQDGSFGLGVYNESGCISWAFVRTATTSSMSRTTITVNISTQTKIRLIAGASLSGYTGGVSIYNAWLT